LKANESKYIKKSTIKTSKSGGYCSLAALNVLLTSNLAVEEGVLMLTLPEIYVLCAIMSFAMKLWVFSIARS